MIQPKGSQKMIHVCAEAVKTHDMELEQGLKEHTIWERRRQKDQRSIINNVRAKLFLEDIKAEFRQYPPQSLEEFEVDENDFLEPQFLEAQVDQKTLLKESSDDFQQYPSPSSFTFEDSLSLVLSDTWSTQEESSKRLTVEIRGDHTPCRGEFSADVSEAVVSSQDPDTKPWARTESEYHCGAGAIFTYRDSPTSTTLSEVEPDEQPPPPCSVAEMSDSSEQMELQYPCSSSFVYRDEYSDSEFFEDAPLERIQVMRVAATKTSSSCRFPSSTKLPTVHSFRVFSSTRYYRQSTTKETHHWHDDMPEQTEIQADSGGEAPYSPWFAYTDSPVSGLPKELLTSHDYRGSESSISCSRNADAFSELHLSQQASHWEPWLQRNGEEALNQADLQFLLPTHRGKYRGIISDEVLSSEDHAHFCNLKPKNRQPFLQQQQQRPSSKLRSSRDESKHLQESSRSTGQQAQDLSKQHSVGISRTQEHKSSNNHDDDDDDDDEIFPSFKSWEIQEEEGPKTKTSTRQQRCSQKQKNPKIVSYVTSHHSWFTSYVPYSSSRKQRRKPAIVPCSGRLFSWPGRMLMFNPNKVRFQDSDSRSFSNLEASRSSFGSGSLCREIRIK